MIKDMSKMMALAREVDMAKVAKLSEKVDLNELLGLVSSLDERTLKQMMKLAAPKQPKALPEVDGDFYDIGALLTRNSAKSSSRCAAYGERGRTDCQRILATRRVPQQLIAKLKALDIIGELFDEDGNRREGAAVLEASSGWRWRASTFRPQRLRCAFQGWRCGRLRWAAPTPKSANGCLSCAISRLSARSA